MLKPFVALALLAPTASALAGECEANFRKSGNPLVMTTYSSAVTVPNLATRDALAQMRGILVAEKMDVMAEDAEGGTLLVEQRQSGSARPIPTTINVSEVASGTRIEMAVKMERGVFSKVEQRQSAKTRPIPTTINVSEVASGTRVEMSVKLERGVFSKVEQIQPYMCGLLAGVKGGKAGVAAAKRGAGASNNEATGNQDVYLFSRMIAREAHKNAIAVNARHKGRKYTLTGRIETLMEDGEDYKVRLRGKVDLPRAHRHPDGRWRRLQPDLRHSRSRRHRAAFAAVRCAVQGQRVLPVPAKPAHQRAGHAGRPEGDLDRHGDGIRQVPPGDLAGELRQGEMTPGAAIKQPCAGDR